MKNYFLIILTGCLLIAMQTYTFGQEKPTGSLFAGNGDTGNTILLKWVTSEFGSKEGFQIYRQNERDTEWELLNSSPVKKMAKLELNPADRDKGILYLEDYIRDNDLSKADPFTLLFLSRKLVELDGLAKFLGLFYQDDTVQPGQTYRYKVVKLEKGKEILVGICAPLIAKPFEPIEPPQGIRIQVDEKVDTMVNVYWTPEEARYFAVNVYRALEGQETTKISENPAIPTRSINADGVSVYPDLFYKRGDHELNKTYTYQLKSIDFFGRESKMSAPVEVIIFDRTPPPPPSDLETVRTGPRDVRVTWAESYAENIAGYDVFVGDSLSAVFEKANETMLPASQTTYIYKIEGEKWGDYFFYIEAINAVGTRSVSTKMGLTVKDLIPPAVPTGLKATPYEGAIEISWDSISDPDLMGYAVYRSVGNTAGVPFAMVSGGAIEVTSFLDSLPREARNKYYYKVAAIDAAGNLSERSEVVSAIMPDVIAPISPTIIKLEIKSDTAVISWLPSIDDELKGYRLYRCFESDTTQWTAIGGELLSPFITMFTDTGLKPDSTYCYQITAEDTTGNISAPSNRYTVKTSPSQGENLIAGKLKVNYNRRKKAATISWDLTSAVSLEGVILYRKDGTGRFLPITELLTKESEYTDPKLEPEKSYFYQLRSYYKDGNMTRSNPVEVVAR